MPPPTMRCVVVEQQLGEAFVAAVRDRAAATRPTETRALPYLMPLRLGFVFGHADPGDFRIGVRDRRNHARVEEGFLARGGFGGDVRFVHRFVREHRLADDVADREDVRRRWCASACRRDEAALVDRDAGLVGADLLAVRAAADGDQHQVVELRLGRRLLAFERDLEPLLGFDRRRSWSSA